MSSAKTKAQQIIDDNAIAVFSKSYCPYCAATKTLLSELGAKYYSIELDQVDDGAAIQDALQEMTKQRSVPNIFIGEEAYWWQLGFAGPESTVAQPSQGGWCSLEHCKIDLGNVV